MSEISILWKVKIISQLSYLIISRSLSDFLDDVKASLLTLEARVMALNTGTTVGTLPQVRRRRQLSLHETTYNTKLLANEFVDRQARSESSSHRLLLCASPFWPQEVKKAAGCRNSSVGSVWARCPQRRGFDPPLGTFSGRGDFSLGVNIGSNPIPPKNSFG